MITLSYLYLVNHTLTFIPTMICDDKKRISKRGNGLTLIMELIHTLKTLYLSFLNTSKGGRRYM